jgi:hypothetical protein
MICERCGSNNVVLIEDEEVYDANDAEVDVFLCMDCVCRMFGPTKECDGAGYA